MTNTYIYWYIFYYIYLIHILIQIFMSYNFHYDIFSYWYNSFAFCSSTFKYESTYYYYFIKDAISVNKVNIWNIIHFLAYCINAIWTFLLTQVLKNNIKWLRRYFIIIMLKFITFRRTFGWLTASNSFVKTNMYVLRK